MEWRDEFEERGYVVLRDVFSQDRIAEAAGEADRLRALWTEEPAAREWPEVRWLTHEDGSGAPRLRGVKHFSRISRVFDRLRTDPVIFDLLAPKLGDDLVSIGETLFWKMPGESLSGIGLHRDSDFRRPPEAFRDLLTSNVKLGVALDPHGPENGGLLFSPGSHRDLGNRIERDRSVMGVEDPYETTQDGFQAPLEPIEMSPGDMVIWNQCLIHGSPPNRSQTLSRRFYVGTYFMSSACDLGYPAFHAGKPVSAYGAASRGAAGAP